VADYRFATIKQPLEFQENEKTGVFGRLLTNWVRSRTERMTEFLIQGTKGMRKRLAMVPIPSNLRGKKKKMNKRRGEGETLGER